TPAPPPAASSTAAVCLDLAFFNTSTRWEITTRSTSGATVIDTKTEYQVEAPAPFAGATTTPVKFTSTVLAGIGAGSIVNGRSYSVVNSQDVLNYGTVTTSTTFGVAITTTITQTPAAILRYSLGVGESFTQTYSSATTGTPFPVPASSVTRTQTFLGFEDVTVPAGTFAGACKWQFVEGGTTTTTWNTRSGLPLRSTSAGSEMVLIGGSINGGALR
ncbi:MAG: hypothetical protein KA778_19440, partial [Burkholderiaceae bacterium]|nr:hypothetical protein [Burkholderiaceae bacterium]